MKPKDAIHVATALDAQVDQLDTFDEGLLKKSQAIGNPPLVIGRPSPYAPGSLMTGWGKAAGKQ